MKKVFLLLAVLVLALALMLSSSSCTGGKKDENAQNEQTKQTEQNEQNEEKNEKTLEDCGAKIVSLMNDMITSESYANLYGLPSEYDATVEKLRGVDYSSPSAIYKLSISKESLTAGVMDLENFSGELKMYLENTLYTSFVSQINSKMGGINSVVVASSFTTSLSFAYDGLKSPEMYLYAFENGAPIIVVYKPGDSGAITAPGTFLIVDDFKTDSAEQIAESFDSFGVRDITVTKK